MRTLGVILLQVVLAVLLGGLLMPAMLFAVPQARAAGPLTPVLLAAILFLLVRLAWPRRARG